MSLLWSVAGKVLEIGPGTGANFPYYPPGTEILAVEPNRHMHAHLLQRAKEFNLKVRLIQAWAEDLPLIDESVNHVVGTLVLCSVKNPGKVVDEIVRV
ncbi:MAG: class I SAM-dependent methyltransferase [Pirellulaceae bacterium]